MKRDRVWGQVRTFLADSKSVEPGTFLGVSSHKFSDPWHNKIDPSDLREIPHLAEKLAVEMGKSVQPTEQLTIHLRCQKAKQQRKFLGKVPRDPERASLVSQRLFKQNEPWSIFVCPLTCELGQESNQCPLDCSK